MLRPSPKAHDRVKVIADLMEQSLSLAEIDRRLGLSGTRVGQITLAHGLTKSSSMAGRPLSNRQAQILAFLREFTTHNSYPHTLREITRDAASAAFRSQITTSGAWRKWST